MVARVKCEHCGLETKHPVVGGRTLNLCCQGCQQVYEFLFQEGLLPLVEEEKVKSDESKP